LSGTNHEHGGNKVRDGAGCLSLPHRNGSKAAYQDLPNDLRIGGAERAATLIESKTSLPQNAVVDDEDAGIDLDVVHGDEIRHKVHEFLVNELRIFQ
jgi:hypothetical protein